MIYVTHDQVEAMTLADKIVVLRDGRIEQVGSPIDLYERPQNTFVAQFIGSPKMNIFSAGDLANGAAETLGRAADADEVVGLRPEHLVPTKTGAVVEGKLELIEGGKFLLNPRNGYRYPIRGGIPVMLIEEGKKHQDKSVAGANGNGVAAKATA